MRIQSILCFLAGCTSVTKDQSPEEIESPTTLATRGFVNMGNTCYFNAMLQMLIHAESVKDAYDSFIVPDDTTPLTLSESIHNEFALIVRRQWNVSAKFQHVAIRPARLFELLKRFEPSLFTLGLQQDAHEALMTLVTASETSRDLSLSHLFRFELVSVMVCQNCERIPQPKLTTENQVMIPLENNDNIYSAGWGVDQRLVPEYLDGVRCEGCEDEPQFAVRVHAVSIYPKLLLVVVQRADAFGAKIHTRILLDSRVKFGTKSYKLIGVVHHHGNSVHSGHYTADFYHSEDHTWYHADDQSVRKSHKITLVSRTAYILLYELI